MIKINIILTASKILAYMIFIVGCIYAFMFHDSSILITAFSVSAGLQGVKTFTAGWTANQTNANIQDTQNINQNYTDSTKENYRGISDK